MKTITRKLLSITLSVIMLLSVVPLSASAISVSDFKDVLPSAWYYEAVDYAVTHNLFNGTGTGTFSPDMGMTRGMFVTVLGNKSKIDKSKFEGVSSFADVNQKAYYAPYVEWAYRAGIISGDGNGNFAPNDRITREQMAKIFYGYAGKTENDTSFSDDKFNTFADKDTVSNYAVEAMKWATTHGIMNGTNIGLEPKGTASRAQVAQVFKNADSILINTDINVIPPSTSGTAWNADEVIRLVKEQTPLLWDEIAIGHGYFTYTPKTTTKTARIVDEILFEYGGCYGDGYEVCCVTFDGTTFYCYYG